MSKEITAILQAYDRLDHSRQRAALATVVHVEGSSYRRPGARMMVTDDGIMTGAISGGCLEGDALRKARLVIHQRQAAVVTYDTTDDDDSRMGVGLGCNGIIHVLLEPLDAADEHNPVELLRVLRTGRQTGVLVTLFVTGGKELTLPGTCAVFSGDARVLRVADHDLAAFIRSEAAGALADGTSKLLSDPRIAPYSAFVEVVEPQVSVVIAGAGNDVIPLTQLAQTLGWQVTVADGRASHARTERFPSAGTVEVVKAEDFARRYPADRRTCFVLMTHNYQYDLAVLEGLLTRDIVYIGVLGPRKKMQRMLDDLGVHQCPDNVYGPVGLHIGAESPEEIALSIIAEIQAVMAGMEVSSLRNLSETIHPRLAGSRY